MNRLNLKQSVALGLAAMTLLLAACTPTMDSNETDASTEADTAVTAPEADFATTPADLTEPETESETLPMETFHMETFQNPLSTGAAPDPVVMYHNGYYYATFTEALGIGLYRSTSLKTLLTGEKITVMNLTDEVQGNVWAPELHYIPSTGKWYIYTSGSTNGWEFGSIRMFCLESVTDDPFGEYVFKGFTDPDTLAIDQTVFYDEASGTLYTAFSEFTSKGQVITLAVMENPWTISDQRIEVSYPRYAWERQGKTEGKDERVNEGPVFLCHNGKLSLIYSASGCWSEYYCLGLIEFTGKNFSVDSMMDKGNWEKHAESIFSAANEVYGVGHCFFFETPDGETWISYHGMHTPDAGEAGRYMYAQPISFDENNLPFLGEPLSRDTVIEFPLERAE